MKTFIDNAGHTWSVSLSIDAFKRVRGLCEVDLMEAVEGKLLERLVSDPVLLCDIIYAVCKGQADIAQISDEEFGRAMAGDALDNATTAFLEELVNFFPKQKRVVLKRALNKLNTLQTKACQLSLKRLEDPRLDKVMEEALKNSGDTFGKWPESQESTPAPLPSENSSG